MRDAFVPAHPDHSWLKDWGARAVGGVTDLEGLDLEGALVEANVFFGPVGADHFGLEDSTTDVTGNSPIALCACNLPGAA